MNTPVAARPTWFKRFCISIARWFDTSVGDNLGKNDDPKKIDWVRSLPFWAMHAMCLGVIWVGWSPIAVGVAVALYAVRMFAITGFYHRYFSHRTFHTSRLMQFLFGLLGCSAVQRGPLWWAAHHRHHHRHSDGPEDIHSPHTGGFLWSHLGWFTSGPNFGTNYKEIPDLAQYPELRFLNRFDMLPPALLAGSVFLLGHLLGKAYPQLHTSGMQMLIWGFFISTVVLAHGTFCINSLTHLIGRRRYPTTDHSRNSLILALITLGEGWHNNHHYYPATARQGFRWWQIDITYYGLKFLSWIGIVWDLKPVPHRVVHAPR